MASITTTDMREYIDSRQKETTVVRKAFTFTARDGTPRHVPEQRRSITGVSNAEINRELLPTPTCAFRAHIMLPCRR
jgi:hypothetical protein